MQCASSITTIPAVDPRPSRTASRKRRLARRSGEIRSRSIASASTSARISDHSSVLAELMVRACTPIFVAASIWLRMRASSGERRMVGPAPWSRRSRVAMK
jgi:hypothetical protein